MAGGIEWGVAARACLCWSAMQGLLVLHPTMIEVAANRRRPMVDLAEGSRVFTRLMLTGMLTTSG
jgi:hypothetical protein